MEGSFESSANENFSKFQKKNSRYLRIRQQTAYSGQQGNGQPGQSQPQNQGPPPQIVLPAQGKFLTHFFLIEICCLGMIEFRDTLTGLIDEFGQVEEDPFELPKPAVIGDKKTKQVSDSPTVSEPILLSRFHSHRVLHPKHLPKYDQNK